MTFTKVVSAASCVVLSCCIGVAADQSQQGTQTQQQNKSTNARSKIDRSRIAAKMLQETNQARAAIQKNNKQEAIAAVDRALNDAKRLQQGASTGNLTPVYAEWDEVSVIAPIAEQQKKSKHTAMASNTHQTNTGSASREATTPQERAAVRDVEAGFTSVAVDGKMAQDHLTSAKTALQNSNLQRADEALAAVQDGVVMVSFDSDMPLLKTREDLALAADQSRQGHYREASAALTAAANGLNEYANTFGKSNAGSVKQVSNQISSYAKNLSSDHANAETRIQDWWDEVTAWMKPPAAQNQNQH
jgi:hypothetical protein